MNKFKFEAYLQEFPFLREILGDQTAGSVSSLAVKRADENLLARTPEERSWNGSLGATDNWERVTFVLPDRVLKGAVAPAGESGSNYAHSTARRWKGETVLEALSRLENPDDVQYIVWEDRDYSDWSGSDLVDNYSVVVYKPPKGVTFGELITKARAQALAEVRAEADF